MLSFLAHEWYLVNEKQHPWCGTFLEGEWEVGSLVYVGDDSATYHLWGACIALLGLPLLWLFLSFFHCPLSDCPCSVTPNPSDIN